MQTGGIILIDINKLKQMEKEAVSYWSKRILAQLRYAVELNQTLDGKYDKVLNNIIEFLAAAAEEDGVIAAAAARMQNKCCSLCQRAKKYQMICAAHAHIDMNWMRWEETVAIVLDTFRTILSLMDEYDEFTFSQSQASVYRIVEEHDPAMLEEIKKRIREGRWEVTAATWVEADKNLSGGESQARHLLYTRRILSEMLDLNRTA